jgi:hypothetical protein
MVDVFESPCAAERLRVARVFIDRIPAPSELRIVGASRGFSERTVPLSGEARGRGAEVLGVIDHTRRGWTGCVR